MPSLRRAATAPVERSIAEGRIDKTKANSQRRRTRRSRQDIDAEEAVHSDTADDILARSPPPDGPENMSKITKRTGMYWAPLIGGATQEEKDLVQQELAAAGKYEFPEQDPEPRVVIAGVPNAPQNLDPPGTGSPFDALKHPKSLIARLNRVPNNYGGLPDGWDDKSLKKIPNSILAKLSPEALAAFPASVRSTFTSRILARLPSEPTAVAMPPAVSGLALRSQQLSNEEQEAETSSLSNLLQASKRTDEPLTRLTMPTIARWNLASGRMLTRTYAIASTPGDGVVSQKSATSRPRPRLVDYSDSESEAARETEAVTQEVGTATTESEEPSGKSVVRGISERHQQSQHPPIGEHEEDISDTRNLLASEGMDEYRSFDNDKDTDTKAIEEDKNLEETSQLKLAAIEAKLKLKEFRKRKADSQSKLSGGAMSHSPLTSAAPVSRPQGRDSESPADPILPAIHRANGSTSQRLAAEKRLIRDSEEGLTSLILSKVSKRRRVSSNTSTSDPPRYAGLSRTGRSYHSPKYLLSTAISQASRRKSSSRLSDSVRSAKSTKAKSANVCNQCRAKRLKCDGVRPSCTACDNDVIQCSFGGDDDQEGGEPPEADEEEQGEPNMTRVPSGMDLQLDGAFDVGGNEPSTHNPDTNDTRFDNIDFDSLSRRPFVARLGLTKELAGKFIHRSSTDHLSLQENTNIPLKFHPKPVFLQMPGFPKKTRLRTAHAYNEISLPQEETFMTRPSVRIIVPDHLKNLLVDDWENVTKSLLVVPLPSKAPVNFIIDSYFDEEKGKRRLGSAEADVLEEFVAGMKVYFDKAIGKTLLYKFERPQWAEIRQLWESGKYPEWNGKGPGDAYGAEHLCRMLVNMPEMVAQTNMDVQSVNRLREEISRLCTWLARNSGRFFCAKYEKPTAEYIEGAR